MSVRDDLQIAQAALSHAQQLLAGESTASVDGATMPPNAALVDADGGFWTLVGHEPHRNQETVGGWADVLLWWHGRMWGLCGSVWYQWVIANVWGRAGEFLPSSDSEQFALDLQRAVLLGFYRGPQ